MCDLLRRSPHNGKQSGPGSLTVCSSNTVTHISGIPCEFCEVSDSASTGANFLRAQHRFEEGQIESSPSEAIRDTETGQKLQGQKWVSAQELVQFNGKLSATAQAIHPAPLHYRSLQHLKHKALQHSQNYSELVRMSPAAREDLEWWLHKVSRWNGRSLQTTPPELEIETDASLTG